MYRRAVKKTARAGRGSTRVSVRLSCKRAQCGLTKVPRGKDTLNDQNVTSGVDLAAATTSQQPEVVDGAQEAGDEESDDSRAVPGGGVDNLVVGPDLPMTEARSVRVCAVQGARMSALTIERMKSEKLKASNKPRVMALMVRMLGRARGQAGNGFIRSPGNLQGHFVGCL